MADAEAACAAAETAIGDKGDFVADTLAVKRRGSGKHLAHAGAAFGTLVADDQHFALFILARFDSSEGRLFIFEHPCGAAEGEVFQACHFHNGAFGGEIAFQRHYAAGGAERGLGGVNHILPGGHFDVFQILGHRLAGDSEAVAMQVAAIKQRLQHHRHATNAIEIERDIFPAGFEVGDVGRFGEDFADIMQVEIDARLMRDGRQMQRAVGGTTGGGDNHRSVLQRFAGDDIARADFVFQQVQHRLAAGERVSIARVIRCGCAGGTGQRQTDSFADAGHGVGSELAAAAAGTRACGLFEFFQIFLGEFTGGVRAHGFKHIHDSDRLTFELAG